MKYRFVHPPARSSIRLRQAIATPSTFFNRFFASSIARDTSRWASIASSASTAAPQCSLPIGFTLVIGTRISSGWSPTICCRYQLEALGAGRHRVKLPLHRQRRRQAYVHGALSPARDVYQNFHHGFFDEPPEPAPIIMPWSMPPGSNSTPPQP